MCNRARFQGEPETIFGNNWIAPRPMDNRFNPVELYPKARAWVVREDERGRGADVMVWDVLGGMAKWPMTNVRNLALPQWRRLAERPEKRCLIPVTEFAEWTSDLHDIGGGKPIKGEMWFAVPDQPVFAIAGFWQVVGETKHFTMVTCEPNDSVALIHPKAMVTILAPADHEQWLSGSYEEAVALQRPFSSQQDGGARARISDANGEGMSEAQRSWWRETIARAGVLGGFAIATIALVLALRAALGR